jgi:predicted helicase
VIKDEKLTDAVLSSNEDFKVVWQVLQALRSHDERLENEINKFEHTHKLPSCVILANTFFPPRKSGSIGAEIRRPVRDTDDYEGYLQPDLQLFPDDLRRNEELFGAATVKRVGNRLYWEDWSKEIGDVTNAVALKIEKIVRGNNANSAVSQEFRKFKKGLSEILNPEISEDDAIAMLAEHLVTLPVFMAIFDNEDFVSKNSITQIMSNMLMKLSDAGLDSETEKLKDYYESVKETVRGIDNPAERQSLVKKIYETFFQYALPKAQEKFGIVYTPNEIVDFMIRSVEHVLKTEFKETLASQGIKILDPFTGTGTFIVRLLDLLHQDGVGIEKLERKYLDDIWCNEIMLLAYYIALINIEATFGAYKGSFLPFEHAVFTDTFQMAERRHNKEYQYSSYSSEYQDFKPAYERQKEEDASEIRVIIANPPYSVGQKNANDNNKNDTYESLDNRIKSTYLKDVKVNNVNSVYDSYVRSFRWASDRITENGIIAYVTNGSFIDNLAFSGFRRSLLEEFQHAYVFNLRGNQRTQGELSRREGGKIFGSGSRATICITVLVKHKGKPNDGFVHYFDIGDYLIREKKLSIIKTFGSIASIDWKTIVPDKGSDWLNKKNDKFADFLLIGDKKNGDGTIFSDHYSRGVATGKDTWLYNFDRNSLKNNIKSFVDVYRSEQIRLRDIIKSPSNLETKSAAITEKVIKDKQKIKWDRELLNKLASNVSLVVDVVSWQTAMYRPFVKVSMAYYPKIIQMNYLWSSIYPEPDSKNIVIAISAPPLKQTFSAIIADSIVDLHLLEQAQVFPLYWYEEQKHTGQIDLFSTEETHSKYEKKYAITDETLKLFREQYEDKSLTKEDIFH